MAIPVPEALLLGLIEGIAGVFPISSDGHFVLAQMLFGGEAGSAARVVMHLGTLGATLLVLRKSAARAWVEGSRGVFRPSLLNQTQGGRDAMAVALATVTTGIVGLPLMGSSQTWASSPSVVGVGLLGSAFAIGSTCLTPEGEKDGPTHWGALLVGVAQGVAVLPGVSRSATTLAVLLWLGVRGERAFELSFLMSVPAILGAEVVASLRAFHGDETLWPLALGALLAFVVGAFSLRLLRRIVERRAVSAFAIYLLPLGLATLAWGYARP